VKTNEEKPTTILEGLEELIKSFQSRLYKTTIQELLPGYNMYGNKLESVGPGGSIGVLTSLDPSIVKSDQLTGLIAGLPDKLPKVWYEFNLKTTLLQRVIGSEEELKVDPIKLNEVLMLNVNSAATVGVVRQLRKGIIKYILKIPVCAEPKSRVTISRRIGNRFRLIGYGIIS